MTSSFGFEEDKPTPAPLIILSGSFSALTPTIYYGYSNHIESISDPSCCLHSCAWWCWCPCREPEEGFLLLEDLTKVANPYLRLDKFKTFDLAHVKLVLENLAQYHGVWWLYLNGKEKFPGFDVDPETFRKGMTFKNQDDQLRSFITNWLKDLVDDLVAMLETRGGEADKILALKKAKKSFVKDCMNRSFALKKHPLATYTHGDLWCNNIMFQYDQDENPIGLKLIDYQLGDFQSPMIDLGYFLSVNTDSEFRAHYLIEVLEHYHDALMVNLGPHRSAEMSKEKFLEEFQANKAAVFIGGFFVLGVVLSPDKFEFNSFSSFKEMSMIRRKNLSAKNPTDKGIQEFQRRIYGLFSELYDGGYFQSA